MRTLLGGVVIGISVLALPGCPPSEFGDALPATVEDVNRIRNDTDLSAQAKREELRRLGLSETTINALLRTERTGNQFGGDLRSALARVQGGTFTALTPDEIQIYGDAAQVVNDSIATISDQQAQLIGQLFDDENLETADNVRDYLNDPGKEVPPDIPEDLLQTLFVDFDPAQVEDQL